MHSKQLMIAPPHPRLDALPALDMLAGPPGCCGGSLPFSVSLCLGLNLFLFLLPQQLIMLDLVLVIDEKQQIILLAQYASQWEDMRQHEH